LDPIKDLKLRSAILLSALFFLTLAGCGREGPERVPVNGRVTYGGGSWPKTGVVYFQPLGSTPGLPMRPALGRFDVDGYFEATSFTPGDGLVPGKYRVRVECWEVEPNPDPKFGPPKSYVPANVSLADLDVPAGSEELNPSWDVPKR
jgi:hypothetical protein